MSETTEVCIDSLRISLINQQRILLLKDLSGERYLPLYIGPFETESIVLALQEIIVSRPHTHDLLKSTISKLGGRLLYVEIVDFHNDMFYADMVIETVDGNVRIDSRPSDAIATALRAHVPICVAREVMDQAAIRPEKDLRSESDFGSHRIGSDDKDDLSAFSDFFSSIGLDDNEDKDDENGALI